MSEPACLIVEVSLYEGRYHGEPEWPPAPARLFQALVAGAAKQAELPEAATRALEWLEQQAPPLIGVPRATAGQRVTLFVPNNDLDALGDPGKVATIRVSKVQRPRLFDAGVPFLYAWRFEASSGEPEALVELARDLYQFGRGVDMAWARAALVSEDELNERLETYGGQLHEPGGSSAEASLPCPQPGTLRSLLEREQTRWARFSSEPLGGKRVAVFNRAPKPRFGLVSYDSPPARALFELRRAEEMGRFESWPQARAVALTEAARDGAAARLAAALPARGDDIEQALIGRTPEGRRALAPGRRVRIIALPSIGHSYADRGIRRLLVEVPSDSLLRADDVFWAFSGLECEVETRRALWMRSEDEGMLAHYGLGPRRAARRWRTVTPAVLPARRRRLEPGRDEKGSAERQAEEREARRAVRVALRHAGVRARLRSLRVQREPFEPREQRVEGFAEGTRFDKESLWHIALDFEARVAGPLVLGNGRFLGLGVCAPERSQEGAWAFDVVAGWSAATDAEAVSRALRRAVMARAQAQLGERPLPRLISGHTEDGGPSEGGGHLAFACDPVARRLYVISPGLRERRAARADEREPLRIVSAALEGFSELLAGASGRLEVAPAAPSFARAKAWRTATRYAVERHGGTGDAEQAIAADVRRACERAGLPKPEAVELQSLRSERGRGLTAEVTLRFAVAVEGPVLLGRRRFQGGGWFLPLNP